MINQYFCFQKVLVHPRSKIRDTENRSSTLYVYLVGIILNINNDICKITFCRIQKDNLQIFPVFSVANLCPVLFGLS